MDQGLGNFFVGDEHITQSPQQGTADRLKLIETAGNADDQLAMLSCHVPQMFGRHRHHSFGEALKLLLAHQMPVPIEWLVIDLTHDLHGRQFLRRHPVVLGDAAKPGGFRTDRANPNHRHIYFVGFAVEYKEPGGAEFFPLKNRLGFPGASGEIDPNILSTRLSPIQKFRWVHFPRNAELPDEFVYRVIPSS